MDSISITTDDMGVVDHLITTGQSCKAACFLRDNYPVTIEQAIGLVRSIQVNAHTPEYTVLRKGWGVKLALKVYFWPEQNHLPTTE